MSKWTVRKSDGVWVVIDQTGRLRYATDQHRMALAFALMKSERSPHLSGLERLFRQTGLWGEPIQKWWHMRNDEEGEQ